MKLIKHIRVRIIWLCVFILIGAFFGSTLLNPDRQCGTGDGLAIIFFAMLFYFLGVIILLVEVYFLHNKQEFKKRNTNLKIIIIPPVLFFVIGLILFKN